MHDSYFQNASNDAIATRKHHANTARTHDQCTAMLHCHDYCGNDVDSLRSSHKRAITGKVLDPTLLCLLMAWGAAGTAGRFDRFFMHSNQSLCTSHSCEHGIELWQENSHDSTFTALMQRVAARSITTSLYEKMAAPPKVLRLIALFDT